MGDPVAQGQSQNRLASPEQLNDYLKVTNPKIWMLLVAVALLLVGLVLWSNFVVVESYAMGTATVSGGEVAIAFDDQDKAKLVEAGMKMEVGGAQTTVVAVGTDELGRVVASARADIADGTYEARIEYASTKVITLLFN